MGQYESGQSDDRKKAQIKRNQGNEKQNKAKMQSILIHGIREYMCYMCYMLYICM